MFKLRELNESDLKTINKWRNNPELIINLGAPFRYINYEIDKKWYDFYINNRSTNVRCSIVDESDKILGLVSLVSIDYISQSAVFNIMIGDKENRGKGLGSFAVKEMLNHAFNNLNLQRVELSVLEYNKVAIHLYEKSGFKYEGRKRRARYKDGRFEDLLMYAILKDEFIQG